MAAGQEVVQATPGNQQQENGGGGGQVRLRDAVLCSAALRVPPVFEFCTRAGQWVVLVRAPTPKARDFHFFPTAVQKTNLGSG